LAHELYILRKLMLFSAGREEDHEIVRRAQTAQTFFIARITIGKLFEGQKLINNTPVFNGKYKYSFSLKSQNALKELNKYFSKKNFMATVRNEFAFHYSKESYEKIKQQIENESDSERFVVYLSEYLGNCFYEMSDTLINRSIFKLMTDLGNQDAIESFVKEIQLIAGYFFDFIEDYVTVFAKKHFDNQYKEIEIPEPPKFNEVIIPFFASTPNH